MTQKKILQLAYFQALDIWAREKEYAKNDNNPFAKVRVENSRKDVEEIERMLVEMERKENK